MKLNIGGGFKRLEGFLNVDFVECVDDEGQQYTDVICDIEKQRLPFDDSTVDEIACEEVLEHLSHNRDNPDGLDAMIFVMNEMWRVLKPDGVMWGKCPREGGPSVFADPTHQRVITKDTFDYFTGTNPYKQNRPRRPGNADYGVKPWNAISVDSGVRFRLSPRKI